MSAEVSIDQQKLREVAPVAPTSPRALKLEAVFLHLAVCAILLPVAAQTFIGFVLVISFLLRRGLPALTPTWQSEGQKQLHQIWQAFVYGLVTVWVIYLFGLVAEVLQLGFSDPVLGKATMQHLRLIGKSGIYGACIVVTFLLASLRKKPGEPLIRVDWVLIFVGLYIAYMVGQRYLGWDWVHGWQSQLPENRFAYGVFRGSGLMGHPLTLAYNAMILCLLSFSHGLWLWTKREKRSRQWFAVSGGAMLIIGLSGSRFPIFVSSLLVVTGLVIYLRSFTAMSFKRIGIYSFLTMASLSLLIVWLDPHLYGRFHEFLGNSGQGLQGEDRFIFWKIHAELARLHPWMGVGLGYYTSILNEAYQQHGLTLLDRKYNAHNIYLQALATSGLLGFCGLLTFLGSFLRLGLKLCALSAHLGIILLVLATMIGGMMQNILSDSEYLFALWFGLGLCLSWILEYRQEKITVL